jgi:hypothetical protein
MLAAPNYLSLLIGVFNNEFAKVRQHHDSVESFLLSQEIFI